MSIPLDQNRRETVEFIGIVFNLLASFSIILFPSVKMAELIDFLYGGNKK